MQELSKIKRTVKQFFFKDLDVNIIFEGYLHVYMFDYKDMLVMLIETTYWSWVKSVFVSLEPGEHFH